MKHKANGVKTSMEHQKLYSLRPELSDVGSVQIIFYKKVLHTLKPSQIKPEIGNSSWNLLRLRPPCQPPAAAAPQSRSSMPEGPLQSQQRLPKAQGGPHRSRKLHQIDAPLRPLTEGSSKAAPVEPSTGAREKGRSSPVPALPSSSLPVSVPDGSSPTAVSSSLTTPPHHRRSSSNRASLRTSLSLPPPGPCSCSSTEEAQFASDLSEPADRPQCARPLFPPLRATSYRDQG
jgi:hypothetical protein